MTSKYIKPNRYNQLQKHNKEKRDMEQLQAEYNQVVAQLGQTEYQLQLFSAKKQQLINQIAEIQAKADKIVSEQPKQEESDVNA